MFHFFNKKKNKSPKNLILFDTIFRKDGWIFECMECNIPTGNNIIIKKYEVYICRSCLLKINLDIKKNKKAYYKKLVELEDYYLKNNK